MAHPPQIFFVLLAALTTTSRSWRASHAALFRPSPSARKVAVFASERISLEEDDPDRKTIDVEAQKVIDSIVQEELAKLAAATPEEQEEKLPTLLDRVEKRTRTAIEEEKNGYQFGDVRAIAAATRAIARAAARASTRAAARATFSVHVHESCSRAAGSQITRSVIESTRSEVKRQMDAEWNMNDITLLLKVGLFMGAGAAAPTVGLAAMPAGVLLATYGTVLKAELGVRAVQEVGVRLAERAAQGIADGVKSYTGKDEYRLGDVTEATVQKLTGNEDYRLGDYTKGAIKSLTGEEKYKFGDISKALFRKMRGEERQPPKEPRPREREEPKDSA